MDLNRNMSNKTKDKKKTDAPGFDPARRSFLAAMATAAGVALAPGVVLYAIGKSAPANAAASGDVRWGMLIDLGRCDNGCDDCVSACAMENGIRGFDRPDTDAQWIRKVEVKYPQSGVS